MKSPFEKLERMNFSSGATVRNFFFRSYFSRGLPGGFLIMLLECGPARINFREWDLPVFTSERSCPFPQARDHRFPKRGDPAGRGQVPEPFGSRRRCDRGGPFLGFPRDGSEDFRGERRKCRRTSRPRPRIREGEEQREGSHVERPVALPDGLPANQPADCGNGRWSARHAPHSRRADDFPSFQSFVPTEEELFTMVNNPFTPPISRGLLSFS